MPVFEELVINDEKKRVIEFKIHLNDDEVIKNSCLYHIKKLPMVKFDLTSESELNLSRRELRGWFSDPF